MAITALCDLTYVPSHPYPLPLPSSLFPLVAFTLFLALPGMASILIHLEVFPHAVPSSWNTLSPLFFGANTCVSFRPKIKWQILSTEYFSDVLPLRWDQFCVFPQYPKQPLSWRFMNTALSLHI